MGRLKISGECLIGYLEAGFSQSEIARQCGITRQAVSSRKYYQKVGGKVLPALPYIQVMLNHRIGLSDIARTVGVSRGAIEYNVDKYLSVNDLGWYVLDYDTIRKRIM